jgi:hypothetical protein
MIWFSLEEAQLDAAPHLLIPVLATLLSSTSCVFQLPHDAIQS